MAAATPSSARWIGELEAKVRLQQQRQKQQLQKQHAPHRREAQPVVKDALVIHDEHAPQWTLADFDIGRKLGEGQFGSVYLARERRSGYLVALKAIKKSQLLVTFNEHLLRREIDIHSHLLHPNILQFFGWFSTATRIYLILEIAPAGELMDKLAHGPLPEPSVSKYMKQIVSAIRCCHRLDVMHRDLKPENILLDVKGNLKLADFGWAAHVSTPQEENTTDGHTGKNYGGAPPPPESSNYQYMKRRRKTYCGTLDYLSPEICRHEWYGKEVDVWCLGVLCYELATGGPPFSYEIYESRGLPLQECRKRQQQDIQTCDVKNRLKSSMSPELKDFLVRALAKDPTQRMTTGQMLRHPFILKYNELDAEDVSEDDGEDDDENAAPPTSSGGTSSKNSEGTDPGTSAAPPPAVGLSSNFFGFARYK